MSRRPTLTASRRNALELELRKIQGERDKLKARARELVEVLESLSLDTELEEEVSIDGQ